MDKKTVKRLKKKYDRFVISHCNKPKYKVPHFARLYGFIGDQHYLVDQDYAPKKEWIDDLDAANALDPVDPLDVSTY